MGSALPFRPKNEVIAVLAEFAGTFMFLLFAFGGTNAVNMASAAVPTDPAAQLLYVSVSFGASLAVNAWVFYRISGGLFNPAVTLGLVLVGAVGWPRGILVFLAQLLGGIAAAGAIQALQPGPLVVATRLAAGTSVVQGFFTEVLLTAQLVFTIFMLAVEKHRATYVAPLGIGASLFIAEMMGVNYTGGSLNPARSFGPAVVTGSFDRYHWIYWVGPFFGAIIAAGFYALMKWLGYESANPGQDSMGGSSLVHDEFAGSGPAPVRGGDCHACDHSLDHHQGRAHRLSSTDSQRYMYEIRHHDTEAGARV
ncbi:aquaporin-like protein [Xylariales sp. PMI_506]|nr:aquaporin-like protein [Xylariales sp. PMI_506]